MIVSAFMHCLPLQHQLSPHLSLVSALLSCSLFPPHKPINATCRQRPLLMGCPPTPCEKLRACDVTQAEGSAIIVVVDNMKEAGVLSKDNLQCPHGQVP